MTGISESGSEKPKRGRPRTVSKEADKFMTGLWGRDKSPRTIRNRFYAQLTINRCGIDETKEYRNRFPYLFPGDEGFRWTVLVELGRLIFDGEEELAMGIAENLNTAGLSVRDAVARIRRHRIGKSAKASSPSLANRLIGVVNEYMRTTDCDWPTALDAISIAERQCREAAGD